MRPIDLRSIGTLSLLALGAALFSSCAVPQREKPDARPTVAPGAPAPAEHIAQFDFARLAAFASCRPPACPSVTPKTLAVEAPPVLPLPRPIEAKAALSLGEAIVADRPRPVAEPTSLGTSAPHPAAEPMSQQVVVHFTFGSAVLSPEGRALIDEGARALPSARRVVISGRTDSIGPPQINQTLALDRAVAVRDHLLAGHPHMAPVVTMEAKGMCCFAAPNDTPQGRGLNRHVEVIFERDAEGS